MAACNLGYLYETGVGVEQSWKDAVAWYRRAVDQGLPRAQYNLAWCYENGRGVLRDQEKALELYRAAAEQAYDGAAEAVERLEKGTKPPKEKGGFFKGLFGWRKG